MRTRRSRPISDRVLRLVLIVASLGAALMLSVLILLVVLSVVASDVVHWLLGDEPLLD